MRNKFIFPIRIYAVIFVVTGFLLLGGASFYALIEIDGLQGEAKQRNTLLAKEEIERSVENVFVEVSSITYKLSIWEETLQQINNPAYYLYWRKNRVADAGFVPGYFSIIELYDAGGNVIGNKNNREISFSPISLVSQGLSLMKSQGEDDLYFSHEIRSGPGSDKIVGYITVKVNFLEALYAIQKFKYIDLHSIEIGLSNSEVVLAKNIANTVQYLVLPNRPFEQLYEYMITTIGKLSVIVAVLSILFLYMMISMLSMPMRRLSDYIDALRGGNENNRKALRNNGLYAVSEIEKVCDSLDNYQNELKLGEEALVASETRNQAILDNVAEAIITIDAQGVIESFNASAGRIFGYAEHEILNRPIFRLVDGDSLADFEKYLKRYVRIYAYEETISTPLELNGQCKNGSRLPIELSLSVMAISDDPLYVAVVRDISERKKDEEKLKYLVNYDTLTNLPNRTYFRSRLEYAMEEADRNERMVGVLFLDLDRFQTINDTLGHELGDKLIQAASMRIRNNCRSVDTVARLGGDEFTVIIENMANVDQAAFMATKLCELLAEPFNVNEQQLFVSASIGITIYPLDDSGADGLIRNADTAMYREKEQGGNGFAFYTPDMNDKARESLILANNLRNALPRKEFYVVYQPRVDMKTGLSVGMEALLRWQNPELGLTSPFHFIPVLEETGLIVPVGEWVLRQAVKQAAEWNRNGLGQLRISVNLSPRQFRQKGLIEMVQLALSDANLDPGLLELEITEGSLMENVEAAIDTLHQLKEMGVHISVDDFGTGYSSLSYLKRFPISTLKIDRSFVKDITVDADDAAISSAIVALARSLSMYITAEGIETNEQLRHLRKLGCDEAQGYLFSKPLEKEEFEYWIQHQLESEVQQVVYKH